VASRPSVRRAWSSKKTGRSILQMRAAIAAAGCLSPHLYGGTGKPGDWTLAQKFHAATESCWLAGCIQAIWHKRSSSQSWGVDVASGIETSPGRKDRQKMLAFIQTARQVTEEAHPC
jgi:phosphoribosylanthranilate isomerase